MQGFRRISRKLIVPMIFVLPLWLVVGRGFFGSVGWGTFMYLFIGTPIIFMSLLTYFFLLITRDDVKTTKMLGLYDSVVLTALYVAIFLQGFFLVDADDTSVNVGSAAMRLFGRGFESASNALFSVFFPASVVLLIAALGLFIYERLYKPLP